MKAKLKILAEQLKACPARNVPIDKPLVMSVWRTMRTIDLEGEDEVSPSVLIGAILYDQEMLHPLLTLEEIAQLETIAQNAMERYRQFTHPPKSVGKALADALKNK